MKWYPTAMIVTKEKGKTRYEIVELLSGDDHAV